MVKLPLMYAPYAPLVYDVDTQRPFPLPALTVTFCIGTRPERLTSITKPLLFPTSSLVPLPNVNVCVPVNAETVLEAVIRKAIVVPAVIELCGGSIMVMLPAVQFTELELIETK